MEDDWTEYYENISKIENYYDEFDSQKHRNGFVLRKFEFWKKYFKKLKKDDPKYWKFFYKTKLDSDIYAFDQLSDKEKNYFKLTIKY